MKKDLAEYTMNQAKTEFCWKSNNCLHFALRYYGIADKIGTDWVRRHRDNYAEVVEQALCKTSFARVETRETGNLVQFKSEDGMDAYGLRWCEEFVVAKSKSGVCWKKDVEVVNEWRKTA